MKLLFLVVLISAASCIFAAATSEPVADPLTPDQHHKLDESVDRIHGHAIVGADLDEKQL